MNGDPWNLFSYGTGKNCMIVVRGQLMQMPSKCHRTPSTP